MVREQKQSTVHMRLNANTRLHQHAAKDVTVIACLTRHCTQLAQSTYQLIPTRCTPQTNPPVHVLR
jgi:hypothetical protein